MPEITMTKQMPGNGQVSAHGLGFVILHSDLVIHSGIRGFGDSGIRNRGLGKTCVTGVTPASRPVVISRLSIPKPESPNECRMPEIPMTKQKPATGGFRPLVSAHGLGFVILHSDLVIHSGIRGFGDSGIRGFPKNIGPDTKTRQRAPARPPINALHAE